MVIQIGAVHRPVERVRTRHVGYLAAHAPDVAGLVLGLEVIIHHALDDARRSDHADLVLREAVVGRIVLAVQDEELRAPGAMPDDVHPVRIAVFVLDAGSVAVTGAIDRSRLGVVRCNRVRE